MTLAGRTLTDRRRAGEALITLIPKEKPKKADVRTRLSVEIGGFGLELRTTFYGDVELKLDREARSEPIAFDNDLTPLGLISRLESALSRFEVELAEERRTMTEVSAWLPALRRDELGRLEGRIGQGTNDG